MSNSTQAKTKYFDLHTRGIGYVSRIREVKPKKGAPFLACTIAALTGSSDSVDYRYIDTTVVGKDAIHLIKRCQDAVESNRQVLVSFNIGDLWVDPFVYSQGEKKGTTWFSLKGRLLAIDWIKVDGEVVFTKSSQSKSTVDEGAVANSTTVESASSLINDSEPDNDSANDDEFEIYTDETALSQASYVLNPAHILNEQFDSLITD